MNISRGRTFAGAITTLALVFGALTALPAAASTTHTVCPAGSDPDCDFTSIQGAIDAAAAGDTIEIAAGTYSAAVTVTKDVDIVGAGDGTSETVLSGGLTVSVSGASLANQLVLSGVRITNSSGVGLTLANGVSNFKLQDSTVVGSSSNGVSISGGASTNSDLVFDGVELTSNGGSGLVMGANVRVDGLTLINSTVSNNSGIGFSYNSSETSTSLTDVLVENSTFFNNSAGADQVNNTGSGDVSLFKFNGNATLRDVSISAPDDSNLSNTALAIIGKDTTQGGFASAGNIVLDGVTVTGFYQRKSPNPLEALLSYGIVIGDYTNTSSTVSMTDVTVDLDRGNALSAWGLGFPLDIGNAKLRAKNASYAAIYIGSGNHNAKTIINASSALIDVSTTGFFSPVATATATQAQLFAMADRVGDALDLGSTPSALTGHVYLKPNTIYVTENSFLAPFTALSLQRAIDTAVAGDTVEIGPGTYPGEVSIAKSNVTLSGAGQNDTILVPSRNYATNNRGISILAGSNGLVIEDLTVDGGGNPGLAAGENFQDGIWWEGVGLPANDVTVQRVTVKNIDRRAISVFPETVTGTLISYVTVDNVTGVRSEPAGMGFQGGEGIKLNGIGTVEHSHVSRARSSINGTSDGTGTTPIRIVNNTVTDIRPWYSVGNPFSIGINFWRRSGSNPIIVEGNNISGSNAGGSGIYVVRPPAGSSISNNTITFTGQNGIGIETGWSPNGQVEIADNQISMGPKSTGIIATGMGAVADPITISGNTISNSSIQGAQANDFWRLGLSTSREVGLLVSSSAPTSRTGDANSGVYAIVTDNVVSGYTDAFVGLRGRNSTNRDFSVSLSGNTFSAIGSRIQYGTLSGSDSDGWVFSSWVPSSALSDYLASEGIDLEADTASFVPTLGTSLSNIWIDETEVSGSLPWSGAGDSLVDVYAYSTPEFIGAAPVTSGAVQLTDLDLSSLSLGSHTLVFVGQTSGSAKAVSIAITKRPQIVNFSTNLEGATMPVASTFTVSASGGASGNPVVISPLSRAICRLSSGVVTSIRPGQCNLVANQAGNAVFADGTASLSVDVVSPETRVPTFGRVIRYADGFGFNISNYDPSWTYTESIISPPLGASINRLGSFVQVEGLSPGQTVEVLVGNTKRFFTGSSSTVSGTSLPPTLLAAVNPTLATPTPTLDGFTVPISNFDPRWQYTATSSVGGATVRVNDSGLVQISGLGAGVSSTVTVSNSRWGYDPGNVTSGPILSLRETPLPVLGLASYPTGSSVSIQISNYGDYAGFEINPTSSVGSASTNASGLITITGLNSPGQRFVLNVEVTRDGYSTVESRVLLASRLPGVTPNLSRLIQRTATGFIVRISNFDSRFDYEAEFASLSASAPAATVVVDRALRRVVVSNLPVGVLASIEVTSTRTGYANATSVPTNPTRSLGGAPS